MSDTTVLREYLVSLGFKSDPVGQKKFGQVLEGLDKKALAFGKSVVGVGVAVQAMAVLFANQMERLYYASNRMGTTVGNLRSMEYAAKQVGVSVGSMDAALEGMAAAMRSQPGLAGYLTKLGIDPMQDRTKMLIALVDKLKTFPIYQAEQIAAMFGVDARTYYDLQANVELLKQAAALRDKMAADAGLDQKAAAEAGLAYKRQLNDITEMYGILKDMAMIALLPQMQEIAGVVKEILKDWTAIARTKIQNPDDNLFMKFLEGAGLVGAKKGVALSDDARKRIAEMGRTATGRIGEETINPKGYQGSQLTPEALEQLVAQGILKERNASPTANTTAPAGLINKQPGTAANQAQADALFAKLEAKYGLPAGTLDAIWYKESSRGKKMLSPAGAQGHFGFMPKTAEEYGIAGKEGDLEASAEAAARKIAGLQKYYKGDMKDAFGAFNWGEGNLDKWKLGQKSMPAETRDYRDSLVNGGVTQTTHINIYGVDGAKDLIPAIRRELDQSNSAVTRSMKARQN